MKRWAGWVSERLSGIVGTTVFVVLSIVTVLGNVATGAQVFNLAIPTNLIVLPAALLVGANVLIRERRRSDSLAREVLRLHEEATQRPDPNEVPRALLALYDEGSEVMSLFHVSIEQMEVTLPAGRARYADWYERCTRLIERERPTQAINFRFSRMSQRAYPPKLVKTETMERYVDLSEAEAFREAIEHARSILANIIKQG